MTHFLIYEQIGNKPNPKIDIKAGEEFHDETGITHKYKMFSGMSEIYEGRFSLQRNQYRHLNSENKSEAPLKNDVR